MPDNDGELIPADVAAFTQGRLSAEDPNVAALLAGAVELARRACGWHVTPRRIEELKLDGPGSSLLTLPTLRLVDLVAVYEDGTLLDVDSLTWSERGMVCKRGGGRWSAEFGSIEVEIEHGFDSAAAWQQAILASVERRSIDFSGSGREVIGPFQYGASTVAAARSAFSGAELAILDSYALEKAP